MLALGGTNIARQEAAARHHFKDFSRDWYSTLSLAPLIKMISAIEDRGGALDILPKDFKLGDIYDHVSTCRINISKWKLDTEPHAVNNVDCLLALPLTSISLSLKGLYPGKENPFDGIVGSLFCIWVQDYEVMVVWRPIFWGVVYLWVALICRGVSSSALSQLLK